MIKLFDYLFYRVYKQYEKWNESYPYTFAEAAIVIIIVFSIYTVATIMSIFNFIPKTLNISKIYIAILLTVVYLATHYRYKTNHVKIIERFDDNEDRNRVMKGFVIIIFIVVIMSFPIITGVLRHNYGFKY